MTYSDYEWKMGLNQISNTIFLPKLQTIFRINLLVNHNSNSRVEVLNFHHAIIELGKQKLSKLTSQSRVEVFNLANAKNDDKIKVAIN